MNNKTDNIRLTALRPFIGLLAEYRYWLLLGFFLTVATLFASVGLLSVSGWFLTGTALAGGTPELTAIAYNFFQPAATVRGFAIGRTVGRWTERVVNHEATFRLLAKYRSWLFAGIAPLSSRQRQRYHGGTLLNRITRDVDALDNLYVRLLLPVSASLVLMTIITVVAVGFLPSLIISFGVLLMAGFVILPVLAWRLGRYIAPLFQECQRNLRVDLLELVDGLETLSLKQTVWQIRRQQTLASSRAWLDSAWQLHKRASLMSNGLSVLIGLMSLLALALMSYSDLNGVWIGGGTILVLACAELLVMLPDAWLKLPGTCAAASHLTQLRDSRADITYPEHSASQPTDSSLSVRRVNFAYDDGVNVLNNIDFSLAPGTHCLIQGSSGGGKTTLMKLLTRLLVQQSGEILLGNVPIADFSQADLRRLVAFAPQDSYLFTDTIANNLRIARPDATDEELKQILHVVGLDDFIGQLANGLDTWTNEGGANLSGGQRRRLGLARALLVDAQWVILDEPTEGLDVDSEKRLIKNVTHYLQGKTLLWVSHRNTSAHQFSRTIILSEGTFQAPT
ncbi:MAG: thiol reductant ABC exporter subunit CydC [Gammaproteobacteria bacterium]|nr:MAG: thiol reductant ABC exporter subunit CydC [Gammaproteobacteria bacterium]